MFKFHYMPLVSQVQIKLLKNDLALPQDLFGNSEGTKLLISTDIFVWYLLRQRDGGLNSGLKSATIVTDAASFLMLYTHMRAIWASFDYFYLSIRTVTRI